MKKILKVVLIIVVVILLIIALVGFFMTRGLNDVETMGINGVNLSNIEDGTYTGSFDGGRWSNEIEVKIKEHQITDIKIIKDIKFPMQEIATRIFDNVIEQQSVTVDVISGATVTSKAYLKSLENALILK